MAEFKEEKLIRDSLGSPIPQYFNVDLQAFAATTADGSVADVDFSKTKLLRDKLGSPIPQLWDVTSGKWIEDTGQGGGNGEAVTMDKVIGLPAELSSVKTQLAHTENHLEGKNLNAEAFVSFVDDDFTDDVMMKWYLDLFESKGIPLNVAIITNLLENQVKLDLAKRVQRLGGNVCSHTHSHVYLDSRNTEATLRQELKTSAETLANHGFNDNIIVYPYGVLDPLAEKITREYYEAGVNAGGGINSADKPYSNFKLYRTPSIGETGVTLDACKAEVLKAKQNGGWVIFMTHAKSTVNWNESVKQDMVALIDFIKSEGVKITSLKETFNKKKNPIDLASSEGDYFRTNQQGLVSWSETNWRKILNTNKLDKRGSYLDFDSPISAFEHGLTNMYFRNVDTGKGKGEPISYGVLHTYRPIPIAGNGDYGAYQTCISGASNRIWKRRWIPENNVWGVWEKIVDTDATNSFIVSPNKNVDNTTSITDFPALSCSIHSFLSGTARGFPGGQFGTLKTYRVDGNLGSIQEYTDISANKIYTRVQTANGWSLWKSSVVEVKDTIVPIDFGEIGAKSYIEKTIDLVGISPNNFIQVNAFNSMGNNLFLFATIPTVDKVSIRVANLSDSPSTLNGRYFKIRVTL